MNEQTKQNKTKNPVTTTWTSCRGRRIIKRKVSLCGNINVKQLFSEEPENWRDSAMMDYEFEKSTMEV